MKDVKKEEPEKNRKGTGGESSLSADREQDWENNWKV